MIIRRGEKANGQPVIVLGIDGDEWKRLSEGTAVATMDLAEVGRVGDLVVVGAIDHDLLLLKLHQMLGPIKAPESFTVKPSGKGN